MQAIACNNYPRVVTWQSDENYLRWIQVYEILKKHLYIFKRKSTLSSFEKSVLYFVESSVVRRLFYFWKPQQEVSTWRRVRDARRSEGRLREGETRRTGGGSRSEGTLIQSLSHCCQIDEQRSSAVLHVKFRLSVQVKLTFNSAVWKNTFCFILIHFFLGEKNPQHYRFPCNERPCFRPAPVRCGVLNFYTGQAGSDTSSASIIFFFSIFP